VLNMKVGPMRNGQAFVAALLILAAAYASPATHARPSDDDSPELRPSVVKLLDDPTLSTEQRDARAIFHGQYDRIDDPSIAQQAEIALRRFDLNDPVLRDPRAPALFRAEAALLRGEIDRIPDLLTHETSIRAALLRAEAHDLLGETAEAVDQLHTIKQRLGDETISDADELTAAAEAIIFLARFEGASPEEYRLAMQLLAKSRIELDKLYWPASLVEAQLLMEKDGSRDAGQAILDALSLNPVSSRAWYLAGRLALSRFDFEGVNRAAAELRQINSDHLLADQLEAQMFLRQKDVASARSIVDTALIRHPSQRRLLAIKAAVDAMSHDDEALARSLEAFNELSPGHPMAHAEAGDMLSYARQYELSERLLREAIERRPNDSAPRLELGLMLMQAGHEHEAADELRNAVRLDPFNRRAANSLKLVRELLQYEMIETEHFIIKYAPGVDEVLARDMPDQLEKIHDEITAIFDHVPERKTLIEIMPNTERFAVRITGMPDIWTIGACTGDVIAITPPRIGKKLSGTFDWANVLRHEFVHTVTLGKTENRIPHWFTEACAVSQQYNLRGYGTHKLLAKSLLDDDLFALGEINWGFIRPQKPTDRPLAYAQADWMLEYLVERFGHGSIVRMLELYRDGTPDVEAVRAVTGQDPETFMEGFRSWARHQVDQWGLGPKPDDLQIKLLLQGKVDDPNEALDTLLEDYPDDPTLLLLHAKRVLKGDDVNASWQALMRYAHARPVDPWPHQQMAKLALAADEPDRAIGPLQHLDQLEEKDGKIAHTLAGLHRDAGRLSAAADAIDRALQREPYNATYRELAATIDLQNRDMPGALHHLESLALLEPQRGVHHVRLAAIYHRLGELDKAHEAAEAALELDADAPVRKFLD